MLGGIQVPLERWNDVISGECNIVMIVKALNDILEWWNNGVFSVGIMKWGLNWTLEWQDKSWMPCWEDELKPWIDSFQAGFRLHWIHVTKEKKSWRCKTGSEARGGKERERWGCGVGEGGWGEWQLMSANENEDDCWYYQLKETLRTIKCRLLVEQ